MRIPGLKTGRIFLRWLRGDALILGYHRIGPSSGPLDELCVSPENFAAHLRELRKRTHPISLSELVQHLKDGTLPEKSVAVTFDDGYADNLYTAKPLLEEYEIPATVFVCTGNLGGEFWWDELERLISASQADPNILHLQSGGRQFEWPRGTLSPREGQPALREEFCRALYHFLLSLDVEGQDEAMGVIRSWSGVSSPGVSVPRAMTEDELLQLVHGGLIEVGAHTRHHPMLPQLSSERQREEIQSNKQELEALLGRKITGFSYPNGRATVEAKGLVQEMGFSYACTSLVDAVGPRSDVFELPRFWQQDVGGEVVAGRLHRRVN